LPVAGLTVSLLRFWPGRCLAFFYIFSFLFFFFIMAIRQLSFRAAAAVLALTSMAACSSKEDDATPTPTNGVSWTVDGTATAPATFGAQALGSDIIVSGTTGTGSTGTSILLTMPKRTGTFAVSDTSTIATASYLIGGATYYDATSGNVVVTTYTPSTTAGASNIAGTFTFTAKESNGTATKTLTNGKFDVKF
jgi:hypothetical protein